MNKINILSAVAAASSLLVSQTGFAQVSEDGMGKLLPVEMFVCQFMDGKGPADLDAVNARWNDFMDDRKMKGYAAWVLYPYYYGADQNFDVIWMGASADGNTMGKGAQDWISGGSEIAAEFNAVMDCPVHVGMSSALYKSAPRNATPGSSVMTMSDCEMNEGTRYSDVRSAELEWAAYLEDNGSKTATFHWFPTYGGGDQDYNYKLVNVYQDFNALGAEWEKFANGGGRQASDGIFGDLDECNDARVYVATSVREVNLRK